MLSSQDESCRTFSWVWCKWCRMTQRTQQLSATKTRLKPILISQILPISHSMQLENLTLVCSSKSSKKWISSSSRSLRLALITSSWSLWTPCWATFLRPLQQVLTSPPKPEQVFLIQVRPVRVAHHSTRHTTSLPKLVTTMTRMSSGDIQVRHSSSSSHSYSRLPLAIRTLKFNLSVDHFKFL